jgi:hypothetical protein
MATAAPLAVDGAMKRQQSPSGNDWRGAVKVLGVFLALALGLMALEFAMQHAHQGKWFLFSR